MITRSPVAGGELALVYGRGVDGAPTLVFLHDSLGCIETWRGFPEQLAQATGCNYLVYDRLGYGQSSPDPDALRRQKDYMHKEAVVLNELLQRLDLTQPILFGHSDGATIALIAAAQEGNRIAGLIVEAPHIFVEEVTLAGVQKAFDSYPNELFRAKLQKYHGAKADDVFYSWTKTWLSNDFRDWSIESLLPQISCPCLIIQGEKDEFGTLRQVEGIVQSVSGPVRKEIVKNTGHSPHKTHKDLTLRSSAKFVEIMK